MVTTPTPTRPATGTRVMVRWPGKARAFEYEVVSWDCAEDGVIAARPSRKHPGNYTTRFWFILTDWITEHPSE